MKHPLAVFLFALTTQIANAQCDTAAVRHWVRTINYDTIYTSAEHGDTTSSIHFRNDSVFDYWYSDPLTGASCYKHFENFYLEYYSWMRGDTEINITYYDNSCVANYYITMYYIDTIRRMRESRHEFECYYYNEAERTKNGKMIREREDKIVMRKGKRYRRIVTTDYTGIFRKRKVYVGEETSPGEFQ